MFANGVTIKLMADINNILGFKGELEPLSARKPSIISSMISDGLTARLEN